MSVGVTGWPVAHSRSPLIFAHWFERYGIDAIYQLVPVAPDDADAFFANLPARWHGVNVTIPHKRTAAQHAVLDETAAQLGSVNTLWREDGQVHGTSSDGHGFVANLTAIVPDWTAREPKTAVIIGAGGAAPPIVHAITPALRRIHVLNRTREKAAELAVPGRVEAHGMEALPALLPEASLLVNVTSLGMVGQPALSIDLAPLPRDAVVADIVYDPLETPLLAAARSRDLVTVDGLGMLLHQATVGFEKWFGIVPEVDEALRAKVLATL